MKRVSLNRALVLEQPERVADGAGGFGTIWQSLGTLWADVQEGSGREARGPAGAVSRLALRITVRGATFDSPKRPRAGQRFREGPRVFSVDAVAEAGMFLVCHAHEEVAQ